MRPGFLRNASTAVLGPVAIAAVLATAMVGLAEVTGVTTLSGAFKAGGERLIDVQMTLVAHLCATAVVIATTALPTRRRRLRRIPPVAAAVGALAAIPLVNARADEYIGGLASDAVLAGVIVGGIAAFLLAPLATHALPGVATHVVLLWLAALASTAMTDTVVYAGLVHPATTSVLDGLPTLVPYALASVVVTAVLAFRFARRGATRGTAVVAAAAAPVLAAVLYPVVGMDRWNAEAAPASAAVALVAALTAAVTARAGRRESTPSQATPVSGTGPGRTATG